MRKYGRVDANHSRIVKELRQLGCSVVSTSDLGDGCPDILVGKDGKTYWFEIKDPSQVPSKRRLTSDEKLFHDQWRGHIAKVETVDEILAELKESGRG